MKTQRPPIVTVLGHVDHGKTTLLDAIRKTQVASREAGGITQGIGATQIETPEGKITFVDTPGHAAFAKMRQRGAKVADIAILVVAADDGIMPQTREALAYIKENNIPLIVAFTKIDLPSANVEKAKGQLEQEEVFFEGRGGQTPFIEVSAKTGQGIEALLEIIHLLAGVNEITSDSQGELQAYIIETNKDKRGTAVSVVVKNGKLKAGELISAGSISGKIKGLFGQNGKPVKEAVPGDPVMILGFSEAPEVGAQVTAGKGSIPETTELKGKKKVSEGQIGIVLKAQKIGSLEAIEATLPQGAVVLASSVGDIAESDVFFAKTANAIIVSFEANTSASVKNLASTEGVEIVSFRIIYELLEFLETRIKQGLLDILGKAEILAEFPFNKTKVAGIKVLSGRMAKQDFAIIMRNEKELGKAKISSMRRGKNELSEAKAGEECGVILSPPLEFEKGDILVATRGAAAKK